MIDWNKPIKPKDLGSWKYKYLGRVEPNTRRLIEASHEGRTTFYITVDDSGKYEFNDKYTVENLPPPAPSRILGFRIQ